MSLFDILGSQTLSLAVGLIPLLGKAHLGGHPDEWVYDKLPDDTKQKGTLQELDTVFSTGKAFIAAIWAFTHK